MPPRGQMRSARLAATTLPGMPQTTEDASSCTITSPPASRMSADSARAVRPHAGKHHRQHIRAVGLGHRAEQHIHRRAAGIFLRIVVDAQHEFSPLANHRHVIVAGRNPDLTALQSLALPCLPAPASRARALRRSASSRVNSGGMCCTITMGTGKSAGNCGISCGQRVRSAGRRADGDNIDACGCERSSELSLPDGTRAAAGISRGPRRHTAP